MTEISTNPVVQTDESRQPSITIPTLGEKSRIYLNKSIELTPVVPQQDIESLRAPRDNEDVALGCCVGLSCGICWGIVVAGNTLAVAAGIGAIVGAIDSDTTPGDVAIEAVKWASIPASLFFCCTTALLSGAGGLIGSDA